MNDRPTRRTRREFLKTAAAGLGVPYVLRASALGAKAPSERIAVGLIGAGNRGIEIARHFLRHEDASVVAVCDVNTAGYG